jgi:ribonuclease VapC
LDKAVVLDSSALLAMFNNEIGGDRVADLTEGALVSSVNLAEIHAKLLNKGVLAEYAWSRIFQTGIEVVPFDIEQARLAAEMIQTTRPYGLSLGDRACLALGILRDATVYTSDRAWMNLPGKLEIQMFR